MTSTSFTSLLSQLLLSLPISAADSLPLAIHGTVLQQLQSMPSSWNQHHHQSDAPSVLVSSGGIQFWSISASCIAVRGGAGCDLAAPGLGSWKRGQGNPLLHFPQDTRKRNGGCELLAAHFPLSLQSISIDPEHKFLYLLSQLLWHIIARWQSISCPLYHNKEATQPYITLFNCFLTL